MNLAFILQAVLAISFVISVLNLSNDIMKNHKGELYGASASKWIKCLGIGALCNFMDTLGIGSFAPTTFLYKATGAGVDDLNLPGTLNVGDTFPVVFEAIIFIASVDCEPVFLVTMCISAMLGSYAGAFVVTKWDLPGCYRCRADPEGIRPWPLRSDWFRNRPDRRQADRCSDR